jgi:excisionase family DNA binding protein
MAKTSFGDLLDEAAHPFLTVAQTAEIFRTDPRTVRADIAAGRIPAVPLGQSYRIPTRWVREKAQATA